MQKMSGFQNGYDMAHLDKFRVLIVFIFRYLNGSEIRKMTIANCVGFLHLTGVPLNLHFHLDMSVSDSESLFNFSVEILNYFGKFISLISQVIFVSLALCAAVFSCLTFPFT